jgi:hypothetical protein
MALKKITELNGGIPLTEITDTDVLYISNQAGTLDGAVTLSTLRDEVLDKTALVLSSDSTASAETPFTFSAPNAVVSNALTLVQFESQTGAKLRVRTDGAFEMGNLDNGHSTLTVSSGTISRSVPDDGNLAGSVILQGGAPGTSGFTSVHPDAGGVELKGGNGAVFAQGAGGPISLQGGQGFGSGNGGDITLTGGIGSGSRGGSISLIGGRDQGSGAGGNVQIRGGSGDTLGTIQFINPSDSSVMLQLADDYIFENPIEISIDDMGTYKIFGGFKVTLPSAVQPYYGQYAQAGMTGQGFMVQYPEYTYPLAPSLGSFDLKTVLTGDSVQMLQNNSIGLFLFRGIDYSTSTEYPGFSIGSVQGPKENFHIGNTTVESTFNLYLGGLDHTLGGYNPQTITISPTHGGLWEVDQGNTSGSDMVIKGGDAYDSGATDRDGGNLILSSGNAWNYGSSGDVSIITGTRTIGGPSDFFGQIEVFFGQIDGSSISLTAGDGYAPNAGGAAGGDINITAGDAGGYGLGSDGGNIILTAGDRSGIGGIWGHIYLDGDITAPAGIINFRNGAQDHTLRIYNDHNPDLGNPGTYTEIHGNGLIRSTDDINISPSSPQTGDGKDVNLTASHGQLGGNGGGVNITAGDGNGSGTGGDVNIRGGTGNTPGKVNVLGELTSNSIIFNEQASAGAISAGEMKLWARNDTPNSLILTNDEGIDTVIGDSTSNASIVDYTVYTVGTGQDFETLMDAISWLQEQTFSGGGHVELRLNTGTHVIAPIVGEEDRYDWYYAVGAFTNAVITIRGVSSATTTIAWDSTDPDNDGYDLFSFLNSYVKFSNLTIDTYGDGFSDYEKYINHEEGFVFYHNCVIKNALMYVSGTNMFLMNTSFDSAPISLNRATVSVSDYSTFLRFENWTGSGPALSVTKGTTFTCTPHVITFTNNTTDTNIPINEIQPEGEYITDGNLGILQENQILKGDVTRTLAPTGGDFSTLTEFFDWLDVSHFENADVRLDVSPGTYTYSPQQRVISSAQGINNLYIIGTNESTCIFNVDMTGFNYQAMLTLLNARVNFTQLTINSTGTGNPALFEVENSSLALQLVTMNDFEFAVKAVHSYINTYQSTFNGITGGPLLGQLLANSCKIEIQDTTFDNISTAQGNAISLFGTTAWMPNLTISNAFNGIEVSASSHVSLEGTTTMTGNTTDYNVVVNEIQYDGSYIANGTSAMSFKA